MPPWPSGVSSLSESVLRVVTAGSVWTRQRRPSQCAASPGWPLATLMLAPRQLTATHKVATPVNWRQGEDVIIAGSVSNDEAKQIFGEWREPKPYIRIVPQPN
jgi:hypothetical protein